MKERIKTIWARTTKFISDWRLKVEYIKNSLVTLHQRLKEMDYEKVKDARIKRNPYQVFFDWLVFEVLQYGILLSFIVVVLFGLEWWKIIPLTPALGIGRWLWLDTVLKTSKAIKGEHD